MPEPTKAELQAALKDLEEHLEGAQADLDAARTRHDDLMERQRQIQAQLEKL